MSLSLVSMLVAGESISIEVRQALRDKRWNDAANCSCVSTLTCAEAGDLLNVSVC